MIKNPRHLNPTLSNSNETRSVVQEDLRSESCMVVSICPRIDVQFIVVYTTRETSNLSEVIVNTEFL